MPDPIFGHHDGETYRSYLSRLEDTGVNEYTPESKAVALMTTVMLMQHGNRNKPINREQFKMAKEALLKSPSFKTMMKDPRAMAALRGNDTEGLFSLLSETETKRREELDRKYKRPEDKAVVAKDAELLDKAIEGLKKKAESAPSTGSPEARRRGKRYREMMKQLEQARSMAQHGIQLSGEQTKALITSIKAYNDGGKKHVKPGGEKQAEGFVESMTLLKNYMPADQFRRYCKLMNMSRGVQGPENLNYVNPEIFEPQRLTGARPAKELIAENRRRMGMAFGSEAAAEALAIRQLSGGNPNKLLNPEEVERKAKEINQPGTAFSKAMQDPKTRENLENLAELGEMDEVTDDLGKIVAEEARMKVVRAAQGEINRSIRRLAGGGPNNRYFTEQYLANILASAKLAESAAGGEKITNAAFRERTEEMLADPAFQRLADRYLNDPAYRESMNRDLLRDGSGRSLSAQYDLERQPVRFRRDQEQPEAAPEQREPEQREPEQELQPQLQA